MEGELEDPHMSMTIIATGLVVVITTAVYILLSYYISSSSMKRKLKGRPPLPPGSLGLPLIGTTIQFINNLANNTMVTFLESKQGKYGQTFKMSVLGTPTVVMEPPTGNKFIFANEGKTLKLLWPESMNKCLGPDTLATRTGEEHRVTRRHVAQFLSPVAVASYISLTERNTLEHLAEFWQPPAGGRGDQPFQLCAYKLMKWFTFRLISYLCLSLQPGLEMVELSNLFTDWTNGMLKLPINLPGFAYYRALKARAKMIDLLGKLIAKRRLELKDGRAVPTQDVLSGLLTHADEKGHMSTNGELIDNSMTLLFAGHDTSSWVLTMTIMYLAQHPEVRRRVKEEHESIAASKGEGDGLTQDDLHRMKYTWQVVQESMRLAPPVVGAFREATTDLEVNGFTILKGWKLYWTNQTVHQNPKYFNEPKKFDPTRFEGSNIVPYTFIPFGGGPRMCPGSDFAKMEMLVFLHHLGRKYTWSLTDRKESVIRSSFPHFPKGTPITVTKLEDEVV